jgi:DNA mismatch repair protein MutL
VRDRALIRAVTHAYQTLLPRGRYPAVVLFVELAHGAVDVNVHPMKTEVRFRHPGAVFEAVYRTLRARLADQATAEFPPVTLPVEPSEAAIEAFAAPATAVREAWPAAREAVAAAARERTLRLVADASAPFAGQAALRLGFGRAAFASDPVALASAPLAITAAAPRYAELKVLGQLFTGYIALEGEDGLILIDQHAAHERVTFEKLRAEFQAGAIRVQPMLTPATLELDPARAARVAAGLPELRAMGFEVEQFGPAAIVLKGAPAIFGAEGGARLLGDMIDAMGDQGFGARGEAFDDCLKTLACHGSVRAGRTLRPPEIAELLTALDATEFKTNCPHGRPVHIEFRRGAIERMFRR